MKKKPQLEAQRPKDKNKNKDALVLLFSI